MQTRRSEPLHEHHHKGLGAARLLLWVLIGTAFVIAGYIAGWIYPENPLAGDLSAAIGAIMLALPILVTAVRDLVEGHVHMDELVAIAVLAAMAQGDFRTAGVIAFFMLISVVIETRTAEGAHAAIEGLIRLTPTMARRLNGDREETVPAAELRPGDRVRLLPGENVPADGRLVSGRTTLNEATITGESMPAEKGTGDEVFAGTQNLTGAVVIEVSRAGEDTTIGKVRDLIMAAEKTRLPITRMIDRYVGYYTPIVLAIAAFVWFFTDDWSRVVAVLVVSCPCAIILATPTAMVAALSAAARLGILVKDVADLEAVSRVDAVVFDKTGTLTTGRLGVVRLAPAGDLPPATLLEAAAGAERFSNHPAAKAIVQLAQETGVPVAEPEEAHEEPGRGVRATVGGAVVLSGRSDWLRTNGITDAELERADTADTADYSVIFVARDGHYLGWIGLQDQVRPEAAPALRGLRAGGVRRIAMVTGDREAAAARVAREIECPEFLAGCLPERKVDFVGQVRRERYRVAFVGDGVNDAPALAAADTGIAMGAAGSDVAIHSAKIALMNNDLRRLPFLVRLSRRTRAVVLQNLAVGMGFIVGGLLLSGTGNLNPIVAALIHNLGSLIVIFNSGRLIRDGEELE
jgi:Zn2+/Cd2+-exporting ATPase